MLRCVVLIITIKCANLITSGVVIRFVCLNKHRIIALGTWKHSLVLLLSLARALQTTTIVASVATSLTNSHERTVLLHLGSHLHELHLRSHLRHRHELATELSSTHSLLVVLEHNQLALVRLQSLHVRLESLHRLVHTTVIDSNTNRSRLLRVDSSLLHHYIHHTTTSHLQLTKSETTTQSRLHVVLLSGATNHRTEQSASGTRSDGSSLLLTEQSAASLLSGLIEPGLHATIPILLEVSIRQNVVMLHLYEF